MVEEQFEYHPASDADWQHDILMDIVNILNREGITDEDDPLVTVIVGIEQEHTRNHD